MKQIACIFLLILSCYCRLASQELPKLSGIVLNEVTKEPIQEANVFFDGTSIHTKTDKNGKFELFPEKIVNASLIIGHIRYDQVLIKNPFNYVPDTILLKERENILNEIVVFDNYSREEKLKAFKDQFIGINNEKKLCRILNEEDIMLFYNSFSKTLYATAEKPLIIENDYLGYKLQYGLVDFKAEYNDSTLNNDVVKRVSFYGTQYFTDISPNNKKIQKRRKEIYKSSSLYFLLNFANNTLDKTDFKLRNKNKSADRNLYFEVTDSLSFKLFRILPDTDVYKKNPHLEEEVVANLVILYKDKALSDIIFLTDSFSIDEYGSINPESIGKIIFSGKIGDQRIGEMLPLDYELK